MPLPLTFFQRASATLLMLSCAAAFAQAEPIIGLAIDAGRSNVEVPGWLASSEHETPRQAYALGGADT